MNKILIILLLLPFGLFGQGNFFWSHIKTTEEVVVYELSLPDETAMDLWFKPDGTKLFILTSSASSGSSKIYEYSLNTAWDISTYTQSNIWVISPADNVPQSLYISPDGTSLYFSSSYSDAIKQYTLSPAFSTVSPTYTGTLNISSLFAYPQGMFFKSDGSMMYVSGVSYSPATNHRIITYELSTPWVITTASYASAIENISFHQKYTEGESLTDLAFNSLGTKSYVLTFYPGYVFEYNVSPAWFPSFGDDNEINLNDEGTRGMYISPDNSYLYVIGTGYAYSSVFIKKFNL